MATYYRTIDFQSPVYLKSTHEHFGLQYTQIDSMLDFEYPQSEPMITPGYPTQHFSVVWKGQLRAPTTETYRLSVDAFNTSQVELIINGQRRLVYNDFSGLGTPESMFVDLEFTQNTFYNIEVRYAQRIGPHKLHLMWESDTRDLEVIPSEYFYYQLCSSFTPFILQVVPDISNATTTALSPQSQIDHKNAIVGVKET